MERKHKKGNGQIDDRHREGSKQHHEGEYRNQGGTDESSDGGALQFARDAEKHYMQQNPERTKPGKQ